MVVSKAPTDIPGLDDITGGGLPRGRTTLLEGGPGCGKTVFALQTLVNGARHHREPGIFVAFEENSRRIIANAATFGWDLPALQREGLFFLDAQPSPELIQSGSFDLGGLLAALDAKVEAMGARRIAFDALDIVLTLLADPVTVRREVYHLHEWLLKRELTAMITHKAGFANSTEQLFDFMQFMVDCSLVLVHEVVEGVSQRHLRVIKYRGSSFEENAAPFVIGGSGIEVAYARGQDHSRAPVTSERVSSGVERLDNMLGGGYFRGAGILITGAPGTAKTTLCGAFAQAACRRGEATLLISFDSRGDELIRNLASVGIDLRESTDAGLLRLVAARAISASAEIHLMRIKNLAREHGARCVVIDPVSALAKSGNIDVAHSVLERLVDWAKHENITLLCTSLLNHVTPQMEGTPLQISTIADTWIHLNYQIHAGERNRGLTIIKSRGTGHSNQVRELILTDSGVTLTDVYTAGGEVLMGTLRFEKERAQQLARQNIDTENRRRRQQLAAETVQLEARLQALQSELELKRLEQAESIKYERAITHDRETTDETLREHRSADTDTR